MINDVTCDGASCPDPGAPVFECRCRRCASEPETYERFHACAAHQDAVGETHQKMRGFPAVWREHAGSKERVRRGFYRHYKGDVYFVTSVSVRDQYGHSNPEAPRDVIYESTQSVESGLPNSHTEELFTTPVEWPDGVVRPRFVRMLPPS